MKAYWSSFIVSLFVSYTFSQESNELELWTYNLGNFVNKHAHKFVASKWPFTTKAIVGDVVDNYIIDSIEKHNYKVWLYLETKGYRYAKDKYYKEVEDEATNIKKALKLVENQPEVISFIERLRLEKRMKSTKLVKINETTYKFSVFSFNINDVDVPEKFEFTAEAHIDRNIVLIEGW